MSFFLRHCKGCRAHGDWGRDGYCGDCTYKMYEASRVTTVVTDKIETVSPPKTQEVKPPAPGKPPISLIPSEAIFEMARSFDYGTSKHGRYAFREGVDFSKLIDATMRHLLALTEGEDLDQESQCLHAGNAMANLAMLIYMMKNKPKFDDRWKK